MKVRTITLLSCPDPSRNRLRNNIPLQGYRFAWPDGCPVTLGLDAFCGSGQRLLHLAAADEERFVEFLCFPVPSRTAERTRFPGHKVRRFALQRHGHQGRVYLIDGTPTEIWFDLTRDDPRVVEWIGLNTLKDGEHCWFDFVAREIPVAKDTVEDYGPDYPLAALAPTVS